MHTLQTSLFENSLDKKGLTVKQAMYVTSPLLEHTHERVHDKVMSAWQHPLEYITYISDNGACVSASWASY